jgi:hypothetical protein
MLVRGSFGRFAFHCGRSRVDGVGGVRSVELRPSRPTNVVSPPTLTRQPPHKLAPSGVRPILVLV